MLSYYADRLPAVEINNTFYRMPRTSTLEQWREQVPPGFMFVLKASRSITHFRRLKNAAEPLDYLLGVSAALGEARGPILCQLPPNMKLDIERLDSFLSLWPGDVRVAFEFRHTSWHDDRVYAVLREHGAALCIADSADDTTPLIATADWGYLRLRRPQYPDTDLTPWCARIREQPWTEVFTFFKHEDAGTGPRLARRFEQLFATG